MAYSGMFSNIGLEQLRRALHTFALEQDWQDAHTPRNLVMALVHEVRRQTTGAGSGHACMRRRGRSATAGFAWRKFRPAAPASRRATAAATETQVCVLHVLRSRQAGELAGVYRWKGDGAASCLTASEKRRVTHELSELLLYLIRLSDVCGVDLGRAALDKLAANAAK